MICPECNGKGKTKHYREVDHDEHRVTLEGFMDVCHTCRGSGMKVQTNSDHIRSMTDEEMAILLARETFRIAKPCLDAFGYGIEEQAIYVTRLNWLKAVYKEDE